MSGAVCCTRCGALTLAQCTCLGLPSAEETITRLRERVAELEETKLKCGTLLHELMQRLDSAKRDEARWVWLIVNGERCFGTLWRDATIGDIDAAMAPRSGGSEGQSDV